MPSVPRVCEKGAVSANRKCRQCQTKTDVSAKKIRQISDLSTSYNELSTHYPESGVSSKNTLESDVSAKSFDDIEYLEKAALFYDFF